jgi:spermidine synthase
LRAAARGGHNRDLIVARLLYALFFVSGSAALLYEVAWVRSLSLVFGGSHLAVATVLAVFMGGLALGGAIFGRRADATARPLRLYGLLELGIAAFGLLFLALIRFYPAVYVPLARLSEENPAYLTVLRVAFATLALAGPTTLMGGTLPVLARLPATRPDALPQRLSMLYAVNTLGAVTGALAAGFVTLEHVGVRRTILVAVALNAAAGLLVLLLPERAFGGGPFAAGTRTVAGNAVPASAVPELTSRLVLWGIGAGGFCALAYEVLWTRMLSMVVGTSVYGFTIMLVAFLSGIGLGSAAWGAWKRRTGSEGPRAVLAFAAVQAGIGVLALAVTATMRHLPDHALRLQNLFTARGDEFAARQGASFLLAFGYMLPPALLLGVAFPLAGTIHAAARRSVAAGVGQVLACNTVGAILGSAVSGFVLIRAFGIERSLLVVCAVNVGVGLVVAASLRGRAAAGMAALGAAAVVAAVALEVDGGRLWDEKYLAIWRNNTRGAFDTPERVRDAIENTDVLYFFQGANETISVVEARGGYRGFIVNGRSEASNARGDLQCQRTLGHLPLLLHPDPRRVFVLGAGSGMTLGAVTLHPEVESIVLAEIEPGVLPATRAFGEYNHRALDDPRLRVVFNDGRNHLQTTRDTFDVITADPIHPWSGGAAYLYTTEYFALAASRLRPGGVIAQWLPIYELTPEDVATVVRTFAQSFPHTMVWLTHWDTELLGSDRPLVIDEAALASRIAGPEIAADLAAVDMDSADDFLSYFLMGTRGCREFARRGRINTDDNLFLEFSAPESMGRSGLMARNVAVLAEHRESVAGYLAPGTDPARREHWRRRHEAARLFDRAHALFLSGGRSGDDVRGALARLEAHSPDFAPLRFLRQEERLRASSVPRPVDFAEFAVRTPDGRTRTLRLSAVVTGVGPSRGAMIVVDNEAREIYGQVYLDREPGELERDLRACASNVLDALRSAYGELAAAGVPPEREAQEVLRRAAADRLVLWAEAEP